jgi:probable rRNA maturation factor
MATVRGSMERKLGLLARKILRLVGVRDASLDIVLLKDAEMRRLKARFFKKKSEPNVISFPEPRTFPHPETKKRYLGEIYLNEDILRRSPERAAPLLLHGMLHLLGYDHKKKTDTSRMEKKEKELIGHLI